MSITVVNWNTQADRDSQPKRAAVRDMLHTLGANIICLTEAYPEYLPEGGHIIQSELSGWGHPEATGARKVLLWSKHKWQQVDASGIDDLPPGRFVAAYHPEFELQVIGVCIPWGRYRSREGLRTWEGHKRYSALLENILKHSQFQTRTILLGDFNTRIGVDNMRGHSKPARDGVLAALNQNKMQIITEGALDPHRGTGLIDHIAITPDLRGNVADILSREQWQTQLSDHPCVIVNLEL